MSEMRAGRPAPGAWAAVLLATLAACSGAPVPKEMEAPPPMREVQTLWTERLELFMEYPLLVAGETSGPWAVHLTVLEGAQPVREGSLTLVFTAEGGSAHEVAVSSPARPGIYTPAVELPRAGTYDLTMRYAGPGLSEEIWIGPVFVYASAAEFPTEAPEPETGIILLKEQQWAVPFATAIAADQVVADAIVVPGEVIAADGRQASVQAPLAGMVASAGAGEWPSEGATVTRGQVLAVLRSVDGEDSWNGLIARAEHLEREVGRLERLLAAEAVPERRVVEARHDLAVVRRAIAAIGEPADSGDALVVRAPIAGVVAARSVQPGMRVNAGDHLYTITDPAEVRVRFHLPAHEARRAPRATAVRYRAEGGEALMVATRRVGISPVLDPVSRSVAVTFAPPPSAALRPGMLLQGHLQVGAGDPGVAIPPSAVRREDGVSVVYVQLAGELFQRRIVTLGPTDGEWTRVLAGVAAGERVVVVGAYQVRLASLNPAAVSDHGHPH